MTTRRPLTPSQDRCLRMTRLMSDKEIAHALGISESTVKKHVYEACQRLGVNRRKAALALLDRNVPDPTFGPMAPSRGVTPDADTKTETTHGQPTPRPAILDLERYSSGPSVPGDYAGREAHGEPLRPGSGRSGSRAVRGPAHDRGGGDGGTDRQGRAGYRPVPRSRLARLAIIIVMTALTALVISAVFNVVMSDQHRYQSAERRGAS